MNHPRGPLLQRLRALVHRLWNSVYFWGLLGWLLVVLRYTSDLIHPRYGF